MIKYLNHHRETCYLDADHIITVKKRSNGYADIWIEVGMSAVWIETSNTIEDIISQWQNIFDRRGGW